MSINADYMDLKMLQGLKGYQKLQALWAHEYGEVMRSLHGTAAKNNESNWRYKAGVLRGFDLAIQQLDRALMAMEKEGEGGETAETRSAEQIIKELRGDKE